MVILRRKRHFKRNMGSPVKSCPGVSLICLSESVRRGPILSGCDIYWGIIRNVHADADKDKLKRLDRFEVNMPRITFDITVGRSFPAFFSRMNEDGANIKIS